MSRSASPLPARFSGPAVLRAALTGLLAATVPFAWTGCAPSASSDDRAGVTADIVQRTFDTPEDAVVALVDAARIGDVGAVRQLFGAGIEELESDSPERTQGDLMRFAAAYDRRHELLIDQAGPESATSSADRGARVVTLAVGDELWEFPVPLVRDGDPPRWRFDTETGVSRVLDDRFDRNANRAVEFLIASIAAQEEFRRLDTGGTSAFAQRFRSDRATRNGLWWPDDLGPPYAPLGPMVDEAMAIADQPVDPWQVRSYRGYRYRVLVAAGPNAPGGAANWLDPRGELVGGFAFLAWPDRYGETGIETLLVAMDGSVWSRDFGSETESIAATLTAFDPGEGWLRWSSGDAE